MTQAMFHRPFRRGRSHSRGLSSGVLKSSGNRRLAASPGCGRGVGNSDCCCGESSRIAIGRSMVLMRWPVETSHRISSRCAPADARSFPSGEKAMAWKTSRGSVDTFSCGFKLRSSFPDSASQRRIPAGLYGPAPESILPSGENATWYIGESDVRPSQRGQNSRRLCPLAESRTRTLPSLHATASRLPSGE